jgi:hypothetical protein
MNLSTKKQRPTCDQVKKKLHTNLRRGRCQLFPPEFANGGSSKGSPTSSVINSRRPSFDDLEET